MKRVMIIGALPLKDTSFLKDRGDVFLVACDGGYLTCLKEGIEPDLFIGDFDTLPKEKLKQPKRVITLNPIKDDTDTLFAIKTCLDEGYKQFFLYGCLGGKIEHTIANIQVLLFLEKNNAKGYLFSDDLKTVLFTLQNESITFLKQDYGSLSTFALTDVVSHVKELHFKYELFDKTLTSFFPLGVSNEFIKTKESPSISVGQGILLVVAPAKSLNIDLLK